MSETRSAFFGETGSMPSLLYCPPLLCPRKKKQDQVPISKQNTQTIQSYFSYPLAPHLVSEIVSFKSYQFVPPHKLTNINPAPTSHNLCIHISRRTRTHVSLWARRPDPFRALSAFTLMFHFRISAILIPPPLAWC